MNGKHFILASLIGGALIAALSNIPIISLGHCLLCMWVWLGALFAAWLYKRFEGQVTVGQGAAVGGLASFLGGLVGAVISLISMTAVTQTIILFADYLPPEFAMRREMIRDLIGPFAIGATFFNLAIYAIFGAIGGLIGGAIFHVEAPVGEKVGLTDQLDRGQQGDEIDRQLEVENRQDVIDQVEAFMNA